MPMRSPKQAAAFTLVEMLLVVSIIVILIAMLLPSLARSKFNARSAICQSHKRQITNGFVNYAMDWDKWYPARFPEKSTHDHPFWWSAGGLDMHEVPEKYFGSANGNKPPEVLLCPIAPDAIWGVDIPWPLSGIYRTNVCVTAGWDWSTSTPSAALPMLPLNQMPQRMGQVPHRPVTFDLIEYMTGNAPTMNGWVLSHTQNPSYHYRSPNNPEAPPPDPIPFGMGDGSVILSRDLEPYYLDDGFGQKFWAAP